MGLIVVAASGALLLLLRLGYALRLAATIRPWVLILTLLGLALELLGIGLGGWLGHGFVVLGLMLLLGGAATIRHWPGGRLLVLGLVLNSIAMATYGRMPITPETLSSVGQRYEPGTLLEQSKDIVAQGWVAHWLGDRFVATIPQLDYTTIWSIGDLVVLCGVARMLTGQVRDERDGV